MEHLSSREKELYIESQNLLKDILHIREKIEKQKNLDAIEIMCENESVFQLLDLKLTLPVLTILKGQKKYYQPIKVSSWTLEQKIKALSLYNKSPATYGLLEQMFSLPSQETLQDLLKKIPLFTGINKQIFTALKNFLKYPSDENEICILMFGKMALRKINISEDNQDCDGQGKREENEAYVFVFMLTGVKGLWQQPIAYYISSQTISPSKLSGLILEILDECLKAGLKVVSTVCDISDLNIKTLQVLGSSTEKPYFLHKGIEFITIFDPSHLMKCFRDHFMKYDIECSVEMINVGENIKKGIAKWSHLEQFYEIDSKNHTFVFAPILTDRHVRPNDKDKMSLTLATEVFCHKVAVGMFTKAATKELPPEANTTGMLFGKMHKLYNALNVDLEDLRSRNTTATRMTKKSAHKKLFEEMKKIISESKFLGPNDNIRPPSQDGWIRTINGIERLWDKMYTMYGIKRISLFRINLDALESFFGYIINICPSNTTPTVSQFADSLKIALLSNLRDYSKDEYDPTGVDYYGTLVENFRKFLDTN